MPASGFGWIDRRFFREGFAAELSTPAIKLYTFLCSVADSTGHSWYGDALVLKLVGLRPGHLAMARGQLKDAGLILYDAGLYRLLALPAQPALLPPAGSAHGKAAGTRAIGDILDGGPL